MHQKRLMKCAFLVLQYNVVVFASKNYLPFVTKYTTQAEQDFILNKPTFFLILFFAEQVVCVSVRNAIPRVFIFFYRSGTVNSQKAVKMAIYSQLSIAKKKPKWLFTVDGQLPF